MEKMKKQSEQNKQKSEIQWKFEIKNSKNRPKKPQRLIMRKNKKRKKKKKRTKTRKEMEKKTKGLLCKQYLHDVDIDFLSITCQIHTHLFSPLYHPLYTWFSLLQANNICCCWTILPLQPTNIKNIITILKYITQYVLIVSKIYFKPRVSVPINDNEKFNYLSFAWETPC